MAHCWECMRGEKAQAMPIDSPEVHLLSCIWSKVAHHLIALSNAHLQAFPGESDGVGAVASLRSNHPANLRPDVTTKLRLELDQEWPGHSDVEEPEAVPLWLKGHLRPGHTIHSVDVT